MTLAFLLIGINPKPLYVRQPEGVPAKQPADPDEKENPFQNVETFRA